MTISLSPDQDRFLQEEVAAGRFASVSDAVREAIDRLRRDREREELRRNLSEARASLDRGDGATIRTAEELTRYLDELEERSRKRLEAERRSP
jgi:antitoxin ParD1/3/4